jgi:hypothetical protein
VLSIVTGVAGVKGISGVSGYTGWTGVVSPPVLTIGQLVSVTVNASKRAVVLLNTASILLFIRTPSGYSTKGVPEQRKR